MSWARLRLGRGPYTVSQCAPNAEFANQLASIAREVRDAATNGRWAVDWAQFNGKMDCGTYACQASDYVQAVRYYCQAISFIMGELRQQRRAK